MDIEKQLAAALRAQQPGPEFTDAVLARVAREAAAPGQIEAPVPMRKRWNLPLALAASVAIACFGAVLVQQQLQQQRVAEARAQLVQALAITSHELNEVHHKLSPDQLQENGI